MEQNQEKKIQIVKRVFFYVAYTGWMLRAFLNTTFFYSSSFARNWNEIALDIVVFLCVIMIAMDFRVCCKEIALLFVVCLCYWIANAVGSAGIGGALFLVYVGRNLPYRKIACYTMVLLGMLLLFTVASSWFGIIENHVFLQAEGRVRYGLGFLYCSYASHYLLLFFMLYFVVRKRVRWYEIVLLLVLNMLGYAMTDTKTDVLSLALMFVLTMVFRLLKDRRKILHALSYLLFLAPFLFWGISLYTAKVFAMESTFWVKLNFYLNGRLDLGNKALKEYPIRLFGQKIRWVGGSAMIKDPTLTYNYVDNNYLSVTLQMGILFTFLMCLVYGRAVYIAIRKGQLAIAAGLFVFMVIGLINPEMRNLLYNTFMLVLLRPAKGFEGIETWKPKKEWIMKENVNDG